MKNKQFLAYSASAGSGKTYALALRYIALLFMGQKPSEILAATFTKKAANEMKQRVLKLLTNLDKEDNFLNSLVSEYSLDREYILKNRKRVLNSFLKSQNYIVTLDSFFTSILRSSALQIGLEPEFTIKDRGSSRVKDGFFNSLDKNGEIGNLVKLSLNLQKRRSEEFLELLENLFEIDALLPSRSYKVGNLDAAIEEIDSLREQTLELVKASGASTTAIKNFDVSNFREFIRKSLFEKESLYEHRNYKKYLKTHPQIESLYQELKQKIAKYHLLLEDRVLYYIFEVYSRYKEARVDYIKGNLELNFSDILYFTYRLLSYEVTKEFLYFKLDTKFKHILLDEFQDTSALQYLILKPLIDEIFAGVGQSDFRTFFYVGDVKQSLYRFRGGVEELFSYVAKEHNIEIAKLDTNYRSAKLIVEKTNDWFEHKISGFNRQKANSSKDGYVEVLQSEELLDAAKERVEFLLKCGVSLEDIAILVFANRDGVAMQEHLKKDGIESILKTSSSLKYNQKIAALVGVVKYFITAEPLYLEPFLQKIGKESVDSSWFNASMSPFEVLERLVREHNYFGKDLNILKLLDYSKSFSTIEHFLDEFEYSNIELAQNRKRGLEIMTIHGSKGLEFKYVIVLDRLGKRPPNRDMLLFKNSSPIKIDKIFYKFKSKENFLKDYKEALEAKKQLQHRDRLNILYVALTRAELGMIVIKKSKSSEFDELELEPMSIGKIEVEVKKPPKELIELQTTLTNYGVQEIRSQDNSEDDGLTDYSAINFGEAMHFALEMVDFYSANSITYAVELVTNRFGHLLEKEQILDIEVRLKSLFKNQEFYSLIDGTKLYKEQPIAYKNSLYQIDLLAKREDKNIVIDYKTSKKFVNKHRNQVKNYIEAIKTIEPKECKGYIVYILEDRVEIERVA